MRKIGLKALTAVLTIGRRSKKHIDWTLLITIFSTIVTLPSSRFIFSKDGEICRLTSAAALKCRSGQTPRYLPPAHMIKLTKERDIVPHSGCIRRAMMGEGSCRRGIPILAEAVNRSGCSSSNLLAVIDR